MLLEALRLILALALLVALPGLLLTNALFPRGSVVRGAARVYMVVAGGLLALMLVGSVLGLLPHGKTGWFQMLAMGGMPNVELAMLALCALLFWIGLLRGAYPRLAARYPRLASAARAPVEP